MALPTPTDVYNLMIAAWNPPNVVGSNSGIIYADVMIAYAVGVI
jgi:hypothetical protein